MTTWSRPISFKRGVSVPTLEIHRHGKRQHIVWVYGRKSNPRTVSPRALVQALHVVFRVSKSQIDELTWCRSFPGENWRPFEKRLKGERIGACMAGFFWLLSHPASPHSVEFREKAAPWARLIHVAMGQDDWNSMCDLLDLSHHERLELLMTTPIYPPKLTLK